MSQGSCPSPPSDESLGDYDSSLDACGRAPSDLERFVVELDLETFGDAEPRSNSNSNSSSGQPEAKRPRLQHNSSSSAESPGTQEKQKGEEPTAKKARLAPDASPSSGDDDEGALEDLTQMKPEAGGATKEAARAERRSTETKAEMPLVWVQRTAPLFQDAKFGFEKPAELFEGIDFAFIGEEAKALAPSVTKQGGTVLASHELSTCLHTASYVAGLWGFTPTCLLISTTPQRTLK